MTKSLEALIAHAKHIVENGGLLARDTSLRLIAALEQAQEREKRAVKLVMDNDSSWEHLFAQYEASQQRIAELEARPLCVHPDHAMLEVAPLCVKLPDADELEKVLTWIAQLPVPTPAATLNYGRVGDAIAVIRAAGGTVAGSD